MDNTPKDLLKFIRQKLKEDYTHNQIKEFLIKNKIDSEQADLLLNSALQEEVKSKGMNKHKVLFLVLIPLIITLVCYPFLFKQSTILTDDKEELCFNLLSELGKRHFNIQTWPTYEEFTKNAVTNPSYRDFRNRRSKTSPPKPAAIWKSYTFGTQTSLDVQDIPDLVKNHVLYFSYTLNNILEACVISELIPEGKYDFTTLNGSYVSNYTEMEPVSMQRIYTDVENFTAYFHNMLYTDKEEEKMFSSHLVTLELGLNESLKKRSSLPPLKFQTVPLKDKIIKWVLLCLIFLLSVVTMYALNRFYLKRF